MTRGEKVFCAVIAFFVLLLISEYLYILTENCSSDGKCRSYTPYTYEVLSVNQYVYTKTDTFGRSKGTELRYAFTYVDMDGAARPYWKWNSAWRSTQVAEGAPLLRE